MNSKKSFLPKVSILYENAAYGCFRERYPNMSTSEIEEILSRGDLYEIEEYVHVAELFDVAGKSLRASFKRDGIIVPDNFLLTLLFSRTPQEKMRKFVSALRLRNYGEYDKAVIVIRALDAMHKKWMRLNESDFFNPERRSNRCRFMPFELIGLEAAMKYRLILDEILLLLDWHVDQALLKSLYWRKQEEFSVENEIFDMADLAEYLHQAEYAALSPRIAMVLRQDKSIAIEMAYS